MIRSIFKPIALAAFLAITVVLNGQPIEKKYEKTFTVDCDTKLNISHQFGSLKIIPTNDKTIQVAVIARVKAQKSKDSQALLEKIEVKMNQTGKEVSIETILHKLKNTKELDIDMEIKVPECIAAKIKHRFGDIILPDYRGKLNIELEFGILSAGKLLNPENEIKLMYSKPSKIVETNTVKLNIQFSSLTIDEAAKIDLNSKYSTLETSVLPALTGKSQFDKLTINKTTYVNLLSKYTTINIGELNGIGKFETKFGELSIDRVKDGFKELNFDSEFTSIKIGLEKHEGFTFEAYGSFSNIKVPFEANRSEKNNKEHVSANLGNKASIIAKLSFGNFKITK